jgi:tRNA A37 N6-isopentenylltransferase MiaA
MNREGRPRLAILLGPTASGKTELGTAWAERLGGEIISADSVQVYRFMDIGTAKPSLDTRRRLRHHLIDMVDPDEPFSASQFEHHARLSISDIRERGRVPLVIGGTGLYIRALLHGLFEGPQGDPAFRERLAGYSCSTRISKKSTLRLLRGFIRTICFVSSGHWRYSTSREFPFHNISSGIVLPRDAIMPFVWGWQRIGLSCIVVLTPV